MKQLIKAEDVLKLWKWVSSEPLPYKYQELKLDEIKKMIENVYIYSSNKLRNTFI